MIEIEVGAGNFAAGVGDVKIVIGDFLTIEGSVEFASDGTFSGEGLLLFVGSGPLELEDGTRNPDAVGILISNTRLTLRKVTGTGGVAGYALAATGDLEILGIPGLVLQATGVFIRLNTTGQTFTGANALIIPEGDSGQTLAQRTVTFTTSDVVLDFGATNITFAIGGLLQISGGVRFSKQPNGTIDISLANVQVRVDIDNTGDFANADVAIGGTANFSIGGPAGFKLQSFKVNGFSLFGSGSLTPPADAAAPVFQPTADLKSPFAGAVLERSVVNGQGYIDVQFNSLNRDANGNEIPLNVQSIIDNGAEFELRINGRLATELGIVVNGRPTAVPGLKNVFRYTFTGAIPEAGEISVRFLPGTFSDTLQTPATNAAEVEYFTLVNRLPTGQLPPAGPVGQLASPVNGSSISLTQINAQRYIDVTFVTRSGSAIDENTINGDEFTLSGAITADLILLPGTGGIPDVIGQPVKIGANTWRYFLRTRRPLAPATPPPPGTPAPTTAPFSAGEVTVTFRAGSFATLDGGLNVARTETFTVGQAQPGETATGGTIDLGPLSLQGPSVGIADVGFADGLLVLTIAIGVNRASLAFGSQTPAAGGQTQQQSSGVTADLLGILGMFDIGVDVFGLLSGNVRVEPGKWSLSVQSLEVVVPDVLVITAEGITVKYDPKSTDPGQELIRIDEATITFLAFDVQGSIRTFDPTPGVNGTAGDEIPGLSIRKNGFTLGVGEICYSCPPPAGIQATSTPPPVTGTSSGAATSNPDGKIRFGSILVLDDIRFIIQNFSYTVDQPVDFNGSIAIASGGAALNIGQSFSAVITDRPNAANDKRSDGSDDTEAIRLQLDFEGGRVKGFVFEVDTLKIRISNFIEISAVGFELNTAAGADEALVQFIQVGAKVTIGGLELGGEARNFRITGDGRFDALPGFGVFLSVGSASGGSFKWPEWLPIRINAIGLEWPNFDEAPERFLITLSVAIEGLPSVGTLEFSGAIEGLKVDPFLLAEGKFPIVDIASIAVSIRGSLFGGQITATLLGGIMKFDANGNVIDIFDTTTPVADRVLFFGIEGGFTIAGLGLTIRLGLSELGPLGVQITAAVPILIVPQIGLTLTNFVAGVEFFKTLPDIDDPFDLRRPEFSASTATSAGDWLTALKAQVAAQYRAIKANPSLNGFTAAFTAPMLITGGADIYSQFLSQFTFRGRVQIKISTDGKFLIVGQLLFLDGLLSMSAKLYANLSRIAEGDLTILFLADIPDDPKILTLYGKFQMGFRSASGEEVTFDLVDEVPNTTNILRPTVALSDPSGSVEATVVNASGREQGGRNYVDVEFIPPAGAALDYDSILDPDGELTLASGSAGSGTCSAHRATTSRSAKPCSRSRPAATPRRR